MKKRQGEGEELGWTLKPKEHTLNSYLPRGHLLEDNEDD
jgi:hypothetical protein